MSSYRELNACNVFGVMKPRNSVSKLSIDEDIRRRVNMAIIQNERKRRRIIDNMLRNTLMPYLDFQRKALESQDHVLKQIEFFFTNKFQFSKAKCIEIEEEVKQTLHTRAVIPDMTEDTKSYYYNCAVTYVETLLEGICAYSKDDTEDGVEHKYETEKADDLNDEVIINDSKTTLSNEEKEEQVADDVVDHRTFANLDSNNPQEFNIDSEFEIIDHECISLLEKEFELDTKLVVELTSKLLIGNIEHNTLTETIPRETRLRPYAKANTLEELIKAAAFHELKKNMATPVAPIRDYMEDLHVTHWRIRSMLLTRNDELLDELNKIHQVYMKNLRLPKYDFKPQEIADKLTFLIFIARSYCEHYRRLLSKKRKAKDVELPFILEDIKGKTDSSIANGVFQYSYDMPINDEPTLFENTYLAKEYKTTNGCRWIRHLKTLIDKVNYVSTLHSLIINTVTQTKYVFDDYEDAVKSVSSLVIDAILRELILGDICIHTTKEEDKLYCRNIHS